jgi:hypothetical protein
LDFLEPDKVLPPEPCLDPDLCDNWAILDRSLITLDNFLNWPSSKNELDFV